MMAVLLVLAAQTAPLSDAVERQAILRASEVFRLTAR